MGLVSTSRHLGLGWVAVEATTLAGAPLIYFNRNQRSIEATWKYLIIGSIGIALALLGSFFFGYAALSGGQAPSLFYDDLLRIAPEMSGPWLDAAFVLMLVGYGTKMGLAPMHTWKPDAYGESPGLAGALFAGGVTSCAFLTLTRMFHLCDAAGDATFARQALIAMGVTSMAVAAVFVLRQRDVKRMLAYSSVEHMGILAIALGLGGPAVFGALLHLVNNALAKGVMFLAAGNIHRAYGSKSTDQVRGVLERLPLSGGLFFAGFLAVTGSPPFGPFVSELTIIKAGFAADATVLMAVFLALLLVVFFGMGSTVLTLVMGPSTTPGPEVRPYRDNLQTALPMLTLMALVLMLGLWIPPPLESLLDEAVASLNAVVP
jgi:hydrogenase-4 component F